MSKTPPDNSLLSAGYLLIRTVTPPDGISDRQLLTSKVISVCECIFPRFPGTYAIEWCAATDEARDEEFASMGIAEDLREAAMDWATDTFEQEHGAWGVFFTLEAARAARAKFLKDSTRIRLIGLGVHQDDARKYLKINQPPPPESGQAPEGTMGHVQALQSDVPLAAGGTFLGYELIETSHRMAGCSWLCHGMEESLAEDLGLKPNEFGLLTDYTEAGRGADHINSNTKGSPEIWMPWALVEYKLK